MNQKNQPSRSGLRLLNQYWGLRKEIYILFFGRVVTSLGGMIWPIMTMILSQKLGFSASEIAYYFVGANLIAMPANLLGGKLADRVNKKMLIVCCDSVSILCYLICAAIPIGLGALALLVLAGLFQTVESPAYDALFADLSATKDRDRAFSLGYLGYNIGFILAPTIAGFLFQNYLWLCFFICGFSIAVSTLLIGLLVKDVTPIEEAGEESTYQAKKEGVGIFTVLREQPLLLLYLFCGALLSSAYGQCAYIMPLDIAEVHGKAGSAIYGTVSSINGITVVVFTPILTKVFAKMRDTGKLLMGRILILGGYFVFLLSLGFVPGYYLAMLIFTWGEIFNVLAEGPYISTRVPASHRGRLNAMLSVFCLVATSGVDIAVGQLYDRAGSRWAWLLILSVIFCAVVLCAVLKRRDRKAYPKLYQEKTPPLQEHIDNPCAAE